MRVLCNITWRCSIGTCEYCWIYGRDGVGAGFLQEEQWKGELSTSQWVQALGRLPDSRTVIDFCGGEPTLHEGFAEIVNHLNPRYVWALTTNLARDSNVETIEKILNTRCTFVNCSYHKEVPFDDWLARFRWLGNLDRFQMTATFVVNPYINYSEEIMTLKSVRNLPKVVRGINLPEYQNPQDASILCGTGKYAGFPATHCSAGKDHIVIVPNGHVCRCLTAWRSSRRKEFMIGNMATQYGITFAPTDSPCDLNCDPLEVQCWEVTRRTGA